ncbi:MAG: zinc ribbon domain-containing protein, partial [Chloroflexota bacterium]|nr:zinc ribbon domain-containing protein [Chloroflexota bacterium]
GGWIPGVHEPVLDDDLFDRAQQARAANRKAFGALSAARTRRTHSLSGLGLCWHCGGRLHVQTDRHSKARIYCYQGRQARRCAQRSTILDVIEDQLAAYLATFQLPEETVAEVIRLHQDAGDRRDDAERRRREIAGRLERIRELYAWGDMTREAYVAERNHLDAELTSLQGTGDQATLLAQAAVFLRDLSAAWKAAAPEQRNALARLVFASVEIADDRVTAIMPQPDFAPFFVAEAVEGGRIDGHGNGAGEPAPSSEVLIGRKRRGSLARDRRGRRAPGALPLPRSGAASTTALREWPIRCWHQRTAHPQGALA